MKSAFLPPEPVDEPLQEDILDVPLDMPADGPEEEGPFLYEEDAVNMVWVF